MNPKKKFKAFYVFLSIVLLAGLLFAVTFTGASIRAIKGAGSVVYPIYLDNNESVAGFQAVINYSTNYLTLIGVEATSRLSDATIAYKDNSPVLNVVVLVNNESEKIQSGNGAVLNLIFDVDESALPDNYTIDLSDLIVSNISAISLEVSEEDGVFEIVEPYGFEFLPPISNFDNFTLQEGATLPLKFNVTNENGFVGDDSITVRVYNLSLGFDYTFEVPEIDIQDNLYLVNLHTGQLNMSEGIYNIDVNFDNYQIELIGFELVDKSQGIGKGRQR